jgi:hypothetical protein
MILSPPLHSFTLTSPTRRATISRHSCSTFGSMYKNNTGARRGLCFMGESISVGDTDRSPKF